MVRGGQDTYWLELHLTMPWVQLSRGLQQYKGADQVGLLDGLKTWALQRSCCLSLSRFVPCASSSEVVGVIPGWLHGLESVHDLILRGKEVALCT